jgi:hypothetical protein
MGMTLHRHLENKTAWYSLGGSFPPVILATFVRDNGPQVLGISEAAWLDGHGYKRTLDAQPLSEAHIEIVRQLEERK